ncbi:MAG: hypothetical protein ABIH00_01065 [Armatimonadota bacterium]
MIAKAKEFKYQWATMGDINGFFGLMLDNVTNLVILTAIMVFGFGFPKEFILTKMIPGTALGVLVGDLIYTWMAFSLAKKIKRQVTAMPLGLDTPSTIGIAIAVLGPTYLVTKSPMITWQVGMATMIFIGIVKVIFSFIGEWVQKVVPQAGLLGSLAGIGLALLGFLPLVLVFKEPLVGIIALGLVIYTLVAKIKFPGNFPGAFAAVLAGTILYFILGKAGLLNHFQTPSLSLMFAPPVPTLGFMKGLKQALIYLPIAIPFGLLTIVGGINVTESAKVAGDTYKTRDILLTEAFSTLIAGVFGGVVQSTPYIGHPAYKKMGSRAAYTLATGLFIGLGGILGYISTIINILPEAALAPMLIFVGLEIIEQAYFACPRKHAPAVTLAFLPIVADMVLIKLETFAAAMQVMLSKVPSDLVTTYGLTAIPVSLQYEFDVVMLLGHGFILTAMLWGAIFALMIDRKLIQSAMYLVVTAVFTFFGIIHSSDPTGKMFLPWNAPSNLTYHFAFGYLILAAALIILSFTKSSKETGTYGDEEISASY